MPRKNTLLLRREKAHETRRTGGEGQAPGPRGAAGSGGEFATVAEEFVALDGGGDANVA